MIKRFWPLVTIVLIVVLSAIIVPASAVLMPGVNNYEEEFYPTFITLDTSLANFPDDVQAGVPFEVYGRLFYTATEYTDQNGNLVREGFTGPPGMWANQPSVTLPFSNKQILISVDGYNIWQEVMTDDGGNYHSTFQIDNFYGPLQALSINALFGGDVQTHYYPGTLKKPLRTVYMAQQAKIPNRHGQGSLTSGTISSGLSSAIGFLILAFAIPFTGISVYFIYRYRKQIRAWLKRRKAKSTISGQVNIETRSDSKTSVQAISTGDPRVEIVFPQIENPLPPVWGLGEPLTISSRALVEKPDSNLQSPPQIKTLDQAIDITVPDYSPVQLEHAFTTQGEFEINVQFGSNTGEKLFGTRKIRIVDYREEIVALFNQLIDSLSARGINVDRKMTAREIEGQLRVKNPDLTSDVLEDIIRGFESANYSLHPVARRIYVEMYLAVERIEEQMKNA
jgi:hypothetical protein